MQPLHKKVGFLGFGNMGQAIFCGLIAQGVLDSSDTLVFDVDEDKRDAATKQGAMVVDSPMALAKACEILIIAIKPQQLVDALGSMKEHLRSDSLIVSIAAGVPIRRIAELLTKSAHIIRVMPNTPAMVNAGASALAASSTCSHGDIAAATTIFDSIGLVVRVDEKDMDAVTALSGSGPAYFFHLVECLVDAAVAQGLDRENAGRLAAQTLYGAGKLLVESRESASELREKVTSKGGTTEAALNVFAERCLSDIVSAAVGAAARRSRELGI